MPTIVDRNDGEISLANFSVYNGANCLGRWANGSTAIGAVVENGYVRNGQVVQTNLTNSTTEGKWYIAMNGTEDI
jgi:alkaline phosphatase D